MIVHPILYSRDRKSTRYPLGIYNLDHKYKKLKINDVCFVRIFKQKYERTFICERTGKISL